jgi:hypothetical protein
MHGVYDQNKGIEKNINELFVNELQDEYQSTNKQKVNNLP